MRTSIAFLVAVALFTVEAVSREGSASPIVGTVHEDIIELKRLIDPRLNWRELAINTDLIREANRSLEVVVTDRIVSREIEKRGIQIDEEVLRNRVDQALRDQLALVDRTYESRDELYKRIRDLNRHVGIALDTWTADADAGEAYWREHLMPRGVGDLQWASLKARAHDPSTREMIRRAEHYDEEVMRGDIADGLRRAMVNEMLVLDVTSGVEVINEEIKRFMLLFSSKGVRGRRINGNATEIEVLCETLSKGDPLPDDDNASWRVVPFRLQGEELRDLSSKGAEFLAQCAITINDVRDGAVGTTFASFGNGNLWKSREFVVLDEIVNPPGAPPKVPVGVREILIKVKRTLVFDRWMAEQIDEHFTLTPEASILRKSVP